MCGKVFVEELVLCGTERVRCYLHEMQSVLVSVLPGDLNAGIEHISHRGRYLSPEVQY